MPQRCSQKRAVALAAAVTALAGCATRTAQPLAPPPAPAPESTAAAVTPEKHPEALSQYALGVSLEAREGPVAALPAYEKAFELDPQNSALVGKLAQIYLGQNAREKALTVLEKAIKANPQSAEPWLWMGIARRSGDETTEAIAAFLEALKLKPDYLAALRALVEVYFQRNELEVVPPLLDRAFHQTSGDAAFWIGLGDLYQSVLKQKPSLGSHIPARRPLDCYEKARPITPRDPELLLRLAEAQMATEDFAAAADSYSQLLKLRPDLSLVRERLAAAFLRADQKEKAIEVLKGILKREPLRYELHNAIAELYEELDQRKEAALHFQQSLDINPNQFEVCARLAFLRFQQKQYDEALQILATAKKKFPTRFAVAYLTGLVFSEKKDYAKAIAAYAEAEKLIETDDQEQVPSAFYFMFGAACERTGQLDRAAALFRKSLELDPKNHIAANYLGYMWADNNQNLTESLQLIQQAVAAQPDNPAYLDSLGWVHYRLGHYEEALKHLQRAANLSAKEPDATIFDHLAEVLLKLNRRAEALQALRKAAELEPDNKTIADKLKKWTSP